MSRPPTQFMQRIEGLDIELDAGDLERFERYLDLLSKANQQFNLTAVRDPDEAWVRHIFDSLTLMPFLSTLDDGDRVADVGSGGGAPGVPLAIAMPHLKFTLIESTGKKAEYLRATASDLQLDHVTVVQERAETVGHDPAYRERFAVVLARALGPMRVALELTMPLAKVGGLGLYIKGAKAQEEIKSAAGALHVLHSKVLEVSLTPTGQIVVVEKQRPASKEYPRRPGEPKRAPL